MAKKKSSTTKSKVAKRYFSKRFFITGHGMVDVGDECTDTILKLWNDSTKISIDKYVT